MKVIGNFMANVSMRFFSYAAAVSMICIYRNASLQSANKG